MQDATAGAQYAAVPLSRDEGAHGMGHAEIRGHFLGAGAHQGQGRRHLTLGSQSARRSQGHHQAAPQEGMAWFPMEMDLLILGKVRVETRFWEWIICLG